MTMQRWMEMVGYRITEGSDHGWDCYGPNAFCLDSWDNVQDRHSFSIVFDTKDQTVYEVQAHDYINQRAYRWIAESWRSTMQAEEKNRSVLENQAWDNVNYVNLEVLDDMFEKMAAIRDGVAYDTRVQVPLDLQDSELLVLMKMAHERDITLNQMVELALEAAIEKAKANN